MPRPLKHLLASGTVGLSHSTRLGWGAAAEALGKWLEVDLRLLLGAAPNGLKGVALRAGTDRLDACFAFTLGGAAILTGRRVALSAPVVPSTITSAMIGSSLGQLIAAPFLEDPAITIQRIIRRDQVPCIDIRCRCPSAVVKLGRSLD